MIIGTNYDWTDEEILEMNIDMELEALKDRGFSKFLLMDLISPISIPIEQLKVLRILHYGKENLKDGLYLK